MGAHQRMARQEARWVLDSQVHVANGGPFRASYKGNFISPPGSKESAAEACRRHKEAAHA